VPTQFIHSLRPHRGCFVVANLVGDYLELHGERPFLLGDWLATLELAEMEDIQVKLDMLLAGGGPDHAAEDLVLAVRLLSAAELGVPECAGLSDTQTLQRLGAWHEANLLERLYRAGLVKLPFGLSVDPAVRRDPQFLDELAPALAKRA